MKIILERAYSDTHTKGYRVLVDRLWPRGVKKEALELDEWCKEIAPSNELRKWFGHEVSHWDEFQKRYRAELSQHSDLLQHLRQAAGDQPLVLVYSAHDTEHNQAVVIRDLLLG